MRFLQIEVFDKIKHRPAVVQLDKYLRKSDRAEMAAMGYDDLIEALDSSLVREDVSFVVRDGSRVLCIFGLSAEVHPQHGRGIWLLGTEALEGYKKEFLYHSRLIVDSWVKNFGQLYNMVDVRNKKAIRWLTWLGAEFSVPFSVGESEFIMFWLGRGE